MARLLRAEGVPMADIAAMLGHAVKGMETTEIYADADPAYLALVVDGIERILDRVATHAKTAPIHAQDLICDQTATKGQNSRRIYVG